jgi:alkylhydroperoxidase family enzyme
MRLDYVPNPPKFSSPEDMAVVEKVRARRAPGDLITLDLTLLHSPAVTDGWGSFLGAIRTRTQSLPETCRELAMARVAIINRCWIEWNEHYNRLIQSTEWADGPGEAGKSILQDPDHRPSAAHLLSRGWNRKQIAVLNYTDSMTKNVTVPDEVFAELKQCCTGPDANAEIVELTATIAAYNCVTRFMIALDVGEANKIDPRKA